MAHKLDSASAARRAARAGSASSSPEALADMSVPQLRARAKELGLSTAGKKAELVERLQAA